MDKSKKPVSLLSLVNTGIDCLFWDVPSKGPLKVRRFTFKIMGPLGGITDQGVYVLGDQVMMYERCTPRMGYWFSYLEINREVLSALNLAGFEVIFDDEHCCFYIKGLQEGYCWPWEGEQVSYKPVI